MNPYIDVTYDGLVASDQDIKVVSTCKMDIHKFPFDTQSCNMTIGSAVYCGERERALSPPQTATSFTSLPRRSPLTSDKELKLTPFSNSSRATQFSREVIKTQGEWEFLRLSVSHNNVTMYDKTWEIITYTVSRQIDGRWTAVCPCPLHLRLAGVQSPYFIPSCTLTLFLSSP